MIELDVFMEWFPAIAERHRMQLSDATIGVYYRRLSAKISTEGFKRASEVLFDSSKSMPTVDEWVATWADICRNEQRVDGPVVAVEVEKWGASGEVEVVQVGAPSPDHLQPSPCPEDVKAQILQALANSPIKQVDGFSSPGGLIAETTVAQVGPLTHYREDF